MRGRLRPDPNDEGAYIPDRADRRRSARAITKLSVYRYAVHESGLNRKMRRDQLREESRALRREVFGRWRKPAC